MNETYVPGLGMAVAMSKQREGCNATNSGSPSVRFRKSSNTRVCLEELNNSSTKAAGSSAEPRNSSAAAGHSSCRWCRSHARQQGSKAESIACDP